MLSRLLKIVSTSASILLSTIIWSVHAGDESTNGTTAIIDLNSALPIVDLQYELYRATSLNVTGQYYNFSNIRYAAPPVGDLRWRNPQPPRVIRNQVNDGMLGYTCPQSSPAWSPISAKQAGEGGKTVPPGLSGQQQNEDCLFLDVISPSKVFAKGRRENHGSLAPVLFNIHGGGYFSGDKTAIYNPRGLLERGKDDFVYVSINYRLGAFGFLAAVEPSSANYTSPNAGFLDQRYALKWVQKYIHLFGGDPQQVTITGESSGGTSVLRHLVAYGGSKPEESGLFIRGVVQSPSLTPIDPQYLKLGANLFLQSAGVSTVDEARNLSTEVLQKAQKQAQVSGPFNVQFFTPVVDDDVLLDYPTRLLKEGKYFKNVTMIAAHNFNEGRHFANQSVSTDADFDNWAYQLFLSTPNVAEKVIKEVYPPLYDGSLPYKNPLERLELCTMELSVACSTNAIGVVPELQSRNYLFSIDPGTHAQDLAYTYYPTGATPGFYPAIAEGLQEYLTHYILTGDLSHKMDLPAWPLYSTHAHVLNITEAGFSQAKDPAANNRCQYWNSVPYFAKPGQVADAHTNMTG